MKKALIYGAGAIGRGYLPRVFTPDNFEYYFVEKNLFIRDKLNEKKKFTSYMTIDNAYDTQIINIIKCFEPGEELEFIQEADVILIAVGPRNFMQLANNFIGINVPIVCFENDSNLPVLMREKTKNENIVFGIPDVITSNTASNHLLENDPLGIITEQGVCFVDERAHTIGGDCKYIDSNELEKQWYAKLYIHNTPHCIAAYIGNLCNAEFLHQAMDNPLAAQIVEGAMYEMKEMLLKKYNIDNDFLEFYANKELQRFGNSLLCDPISRVAREPFRKLAKNERLIGAAALCLSVGIVPKNLILGIMAAFCFDKDNDADFHIKYLISSLRPKDFLRIIIGLRPGEALFEVLIDNWENNLELIENLKNEK